MENKPWHKKPLFLSLLDLSKIRDNLRKNNLHDTSQLPNTDKLPQPEPDPEGRHLKARTADGSFNDLEQPAMGMTGTRFGRNMPLKEVYPDTPNLLNPNPRVISQKLLKREEFQPATILNVLAAAWIQFQNHEWFAHFEGVDEDAIDIPLSEDDSWPQEHRPLKIKKTPADPTRPAGDKSGPPTFLSRSTHWWDGSQIYGSNEEAANELRSHQDGKLTIGEDGLLSLDTNGLDLTGNNDNYWAGMSLLHTLFVKEHNILCDHLKQRYPNWTDDDLFDHAHLINAALMAKIHTVEWTPGLLQHPALQIGMRANWWGILEQHFKNLFGRLGDNEALSGIIGSSTSHHGAPYYLTEEFVSAYRLHPLIPDDFEIRSLENNKVLAEKNFFEISGKRTREIVEQFGMPNLFYTVGIAYPGAIELHNYPHFLQNLVRDNGEVLDLACIDIVRDRERGVPRYNRFRELIGMGKLNSFDEITSRPGWAKELREIYNNDLEAVDLMVGMYAEDKPAGFAISDTAFRVFVLMASRRLKSDRFFTKDYTAEVYTQFGLDWIDKNTMADVILRHYPMLAPTLRGVGNAFAPWRKVGITGY